VKFIDNKLLVILFHIYPLANSIRASELALHLCGTGFPD